MLLAACAIQPGGDPLTVGVAGLELLPSEGMEGRFLVKVRLENPNEAPVAFNGVSISLNMGDSQLASGVSDASGTIPRFGETVLAVPVAVPLTSIVGEVLSLASGNLSHLNFALRGRLAQPDLRGVDFNSTANLELPWYITELLLL